MRNVIQSILILQEKNLKLFFKPCKADKCQKFWDDPVKLVPTCSEAIGYRSVSMLNNMDETCAEYDEACVAVTAANVAAGGATNSKTTAGGTTDTKTTTDGASDIKTSDDKSATSIITTSFAFILFSLL